MLNVTDCKALGSEVHADNIMNENNQEVLKKQELPSKKSIIPRVWIMKMKKKAVQKMTLKSLRLIKKIPKQRIC